jgi:hypothetical protein
MQATQASVSVTKLVIGAGDCAEYTIRTAFFIRLKKEEFRGIVVTESLLAAKEGSGDDKIN